MTIAMRFLVVTLVVAAVSERGLAQKSASNTNGQTFEVVSIKPNASGGGSTRVGVQPGGRFVMSNGDPMQLILNAYDYLPFEVIGAPSWMSSERYDVIANAGREPARDEMKAMLRALLADRFKLTTHTETRQLPAYALVRARVDGQLGPQLRPSDVDCEAFRAGRGAAPAPRPPAQSTRPEAPTCGMQARPGFYAAGGTTIAAFIASLSSDLERRVTDMTGLVGEYKIVVQWAPDDRPGSDVPSLFTALREQLGLKLDPLTGPAEVLVIDHIEHPTED